jgi:hypothetical protein
MNKLKRLSINKNDIIESEEENNNASALNPKFLNYIELNNSTCRSENVLDSIRASPNTIKNQQHYQTSIKNNFVN